MVSTALALLLAAAAPTLVLGGVFAAPRLFAAMAEAHRRRLRRRGRLVAPAGPPIERLAADLRRLRAARSATDCSRVQRVGARRAYEDVLIEAAQALGVGHDLKAACGMARELELLRVEQALLEAGLALA